MISTSKILPALKTIIPLPGLLTVVLILCIHFGLNAQQTEGVNITNEVDTIKKPAAYVHSPKKATIYAMVLPGLGQAYNKKYWKIPIVYAGFGTIGYFISNNTKYFRQYKEAYIYASGGKVGPAPNEYGLKYTADQLSTMMDYYNRNVEVSYIALGLWYILTIVDADVDAHFFNYDVSEDLSLNLSPDIVPSYYPGSFASSGISLKLKF